jgi:hypothetical protein
MLLKQKVSGFDDATRCFSGKMDLAILVDASDDFRKRDKARLHHFIVKLLRPFKFGGENIKLSMITINKNSYQMFDFEQFDFDIKTGGRSAVESRIRKVIKPGGPHNTASILGVTRDKLVGGCGDRTTAPNLALLITGGALLKSDRKQTLHEAMTLKQKGVHILGLVVGRCKRDFLSVVTNSENVICLKKLKLLPSFIEEVRGKICKEIENQ